MKASYIDILTNRNQDSGVTAFQLPKLQKVAIVENIKHLGIIHAYKPERLRNCIIKQPKTYIDFFGKNEKNTTNEVFFRSVLAHFREWKNMIAEGMVDAF